MYTYILSSRFTNRCSFHHWKTSFGITFILSLKMFRFRGVTGIDPENTVFVERIEPRNYTTLLSSTDFFKSRNHTRQLISNILDFEVKDKYIFVTQKKVRHFIIMLYSSIFQIIMTN